MSNNDNLVRVYTGTEMKVLLLKSLLEEICVHSLVQNNYKSGVEIGFVGGVQSAIDLYVTQTDLEKAGPVISDFIERNK